MSARDTQVGGTHYKTMGVEPWDVVDTWPLEQRIGYYRGGALKYVMRMGTKDERAQEIRKGAHYMQKLAEVLEEKNHESTQSDQAAVDYREKVLAAYRLNYGVMGLGDDC